MTFIGELEKLSLTPDFMTSDQASQVIQMVNRKVERALKPHIIDILWKEEAKFGVILQPLQAMSWANSSRGRAKPFEIRHGAQEKEGIWAWLYEHRKPVWLENILDGDLRKPAKNLASEDDELIDPSYLQIFRDTDALLAVPLVTRDILWGVYSLELPALRRFTREAVSQVMRLAKPIARVIWKMKTLEHNHEQTSRAIQLFASSIEEYPSEDPAEQYKSGFIARPFEPSFTAVEDLIAASLRKKKIRAECYQHTPGTREYVIDAIAERIDNSHFFIADVTGAKPNVMVEIGVMLARRKRKILLRRHDDEGEIPFNLRSEHIYSYRMEEDNLQCLNPGTGRFESFESVLSAFVSDLEKNDHSFFNAKDWH